MDFIDTKSLYTILHIFGAALGAGGAYMSDAMFFSSVRDERISTTELRFLKIGSRFVWIGLGLLVLSGIGIFLTDPTTYIHSSKFLAKMSIVLVIAVNGIVFHMAHLPRIQRHTNGHLPSSDEFMRKKHFLIGSGVVSFVSWTCALVLGSLKSVPFSYYEILSVYALVVVAGVFVASLTSRHIIKL